MHPGALTAAVHDRTLVIQEHTDTESRATLPCTEAEDLCGELEWQHRQHAIRQIQAGGPSTGLTVKGAVRFDQSCRISDVDPDPGATIARFQCQAIVDFLGAGVIQGVNPLCRQIHAGVITGTSVSCSGQQLVDDFGVRLWKLARPRTAAQRAGLVRIQQLTCHKPGLQGLAIGGQPQQLE